MRESRCFRRQLPAHLLALFAAVDMSPIATPVDDEGVSASLAVDDQALQKGSSERKTGLAGQPGTQSSCSSRYHPGRARSPPEPPHAPLPLSFTPLLPARQFSPHTAEIRISVIPVKVDLVLVGGDTRVGVWGVSRWNLDPNRLGRQSEASVPGS